MNLPDIIKTDLKNCGYPQLFGSRSMAARPSKEDFDPDTMIGSQINSSTDWDFSQQYSDELHQYLISVGYAAYTSESLGAYADDLTVAVYVKEFRPSFSLKNLFAYSDADIVKVNVVLHNNEELFRRVWDRITPEFYHNYLWKRSRNYGHIDDRYEIKSKITTIMNQLYAVAA
jgi:hypothetical protein